MLSRRSVIRAIFRGGLGAGLSAALAPLASLATERNALAAPGEAPFSVIVLWMNGGPSHIDTWDPRAGTKIGGPAKSIATRTPGLRISEHMPRLAELSNLFSVVRSLSTKEGNHQRAQYLMRTGYAPNPTIVHPSFGGWVSKLGSAPDSGLPAFVSVGGPSLGAGFFGVEFGPLVLPKAGATPENVGFGADTDDERFRARRALLAELEREFAQRTGDPKILARDGVYDKAERLMRSPALDVFDLKRESEATRKAYGDTDFGRGCLIAARLVERGVRFVDVTLDGWDTHKDNFGRTKRLMGVLDPAMSALLKDLRARRLLERTLVVWVGDFGRTPKINADDGRDHFPNVSSCVLAGAKIRPGLVYGETDAEASRVTKNPVSVSDLAATLFSAIKIDAHVTFQTPVGRPIAATDAGTPISALLS